MEAGTKMSCTHTERLGIGVFLPLPGVILVAVFNRLASVEDVRVGIPRLHQQYLLLFCDILPCLSLHQSMHVTATDELKVARKLGWSQDKRQV